MSRSMLLSVCLALSICLPGAARAAGAQELDDLLDDDLGLVTDGTVFQLDQEGDEDLDLLDEDDVDIEGGQTHSTDLLQLEDAPLLEDETEEAIEEETYVPAPVALPTFTDLDEEGESFEFETPPAPPKAAAPSKAVVLNLDVTGKEPLSDSFALQVVAVGKDMVVVELPVLLAVSGVGHESDDYFLIGEVSRGGQIVAVVQQHVLASSFAALGPTVAWLKVSVPVDEPTGEITMSVRRNDAGAAESATLFTRGTTYSLR